LPRRGSSPRARETRDDGSTGWTSDRGQLPAGAVKLGAERELGGRIDLAHQSRRTAAIHFCCSRDQTRIPVIGEDRTASRFLGRSQSPRSPAPTARGTVVVLLGEILKASGRRTLSAGNLGTPLIDAVDGKWERRGGRRSSFQLDGSRNPARAACILISPTIISIATKISRTTAGQKRAVREPAGLGLRDFESRNPSVWEARETLRAE